MSLLLILEMILAAVLAAGFYSVVGAMPGADETATIAPLTLVLVLAGLHPAVVLAFFVSAIVAAKLIDAVPVSIAGIPAGVMATPMVAHAMVLKRHGLTETSIRKIASGAVIGTLVSLPISLFLAKALVPFAEVIKAYGSPTFFIGAILLALMSKQKIMALLTILPFSLLIQGLRLLYGQIGNVPEGKTVFISFFLGITIGPMILSLFELLNKKELEGKPRYKKKVIFLKEGNKKGTSLNPFKILTKEESLSSALASVVGSLAFILSPVGLTVLLGEFVGSRKKDEVEKASIALTTMEALAQATYISGTLIPLIALGIPLSPMAIGPANPLFNAPPVLTLENNLHHILSSGDFVVASLIGALIGLSITFYLAVRYAGTICRFVFGRIPHEALLGLFFALVILLAYMDGGLVNIAGVLLLGLVSGTLLRQGIGYGVLFMVLYAAPWLVGKLSIF